MNDPDTASHREDDVLDDEAWDPFEAFAQDVGGAAKGPPSPYPTFAELRRRGPVHEGTPGDLMGVELWGAEMVARLASDAGAYTIVRYDEVAQVLRDGDTFSSKVYEPSLGIVMGHSILEMDEPEHKRYRSLIEQAFTKKAMARWEAELIRPIVGRTVDRVAARGRVDLARELTFPFPIHVITGMLGLPEEDMPRFHRLAVGLITVSAHPERGIRAAQKLREYLDPMIDGRRARPRDDLISALTWTELDGHRLTNDEIVAFLRLLLPAGAETTYSSTGSLLLGLLERPEQLEALRRDRSLLPQAIEEGLRWEPPLTWIVRMAARDAEVAGVKIPRGAVVSPCIGSANHDEARWERPEDLDISRKPRPHLAFAHGPHTCLGMHLARQEMTIAIGTLLDRAPSIVLDPEAPEPRIRGLQFRRPGAVPVVIGW